MSTKVEERHRKLAEKIQGPYAPFGPPESLERRKVSHSKRIEELAELLAENERQVRLEGFKQGIEASAQILDNEIRLREKFDAHMEPLDALARLMRKQAQPHEAEGGK